MNSSTGSSNAGYHVGPEGRVKAAAIQVAAETGEKERNLQTLLNPVERACDDGAQLLVLPELANTGYAFESRREVASLAEPVGGPTTQLLHELARTYGAYLCSGFLELDAGYFYNSALLVGPDGPIGRYRKIHLWDREKLFFEPGNLGLNVFQLPFGRVGMMICYDGWHPEVARILKVKGADIVLDPTCWVPVAGAAADGEPMAPQIHLVTAHVNSLFLVCADQCGTDRGVSYLGRSCIAGPNGFVAGPADPEAPAVISAEVNPVSARYHHWTPLVDPIADRRTDLFEDHLGYCDPPYAWMASLAQGGVVSAPQVQEET